MIRKPRPLRPLRPTSGRLILFYALVFGTLGSLSACGKKETVDVWRLTPPVLETTDFGTAPAKVSTFTVSAKMGGFENAVTNDSTVLRFASADRGLAMTTKSSCRSDAKDGTEPSDEFEYSGKTADAVSILRVLPPSVMSPESLAKDWTCSLRVLVTNSGGSSHSFSLSSFKLNFKTTRDRIATLQLRPLEAAKSQMTVSSYRLVCSSWWIDVPPDRDISAEARTQTVHGVDTRLSDRQPRCTMIDLGTVEQGNKTQIIGLYRANFGRLNITWATETLAAHSALERILERPVARFTIHNNGRSPVIAFLPISIFVKLSVRSNNTAWGAGWTLPLKAPIAVRIEGTQPRQTGSGFYFVLNPNSPVRISFDATRGPTGCLYNQLGVSHVMATAVTPIYLRTLSDEALDLTAPNEALDAAARAPLTADEPALFSTLVSQSVPGQDAFIATTMTAEEAMSMAPPAPAMCTNGPKYDPGDLINLKPVLTE